MSLAPLVLAALVLVTPSREEVTAAKRERTVFHLTDGRVVCADAKIGAGGYSVRSGSEWTWVPNEAVLRATPEREVRRVLNDMRKASAVGDPARVEVAHAALREGLLEESIREIDAVLARDPDQAAARAFVAGAPLTLSFPASSDRSTEARLVLMGARAQPAYRELAANRLGDAPREAVLAELARALKSPYASVRAFAAFALRRIDPKAQADALVRRAVVDSSETVRVEAARTLRDARDETLVLRVAAALDLQDTRLSTAAATSLGEMGHAAALPVLAARLAALQSSGGHPGGTRAHLRVGSQVAYVQDFDVEIAQAASIADPIVGMVEDGTLLDVRVGGTSVVSAADQRRALCLELCRAMQRISGVELPEKAERWVAWWDAQAKEPSTPYGVR